MVLKVLSRSPSMTRAIARAIAGKLYPGAMLLLEGDLGSGKTVFVQGLAQGLGISQKNVRSPTFAIIQEYPAHNFEDAFNSVHSRKQKVIHSRYKIRPKNLYCSPSASCQQNSKLCAGLCHVDLYRVSPREIKNLGLEEYWLGKNWIVAVEWADKAKNFFPSPALTIKFNFLSAPPLKTLSDGAVPSLSLLRKGTENKRELIFSGNQRWLKILKLLKKF